MPWAATPDVTRELVGLGMRVLAETPPASDLEGLRALRNEDGASGRVQVAEQYLLMPAHAARLAIVRDGLIGEPKSVQVSSTHLYHAVSMIRGLLGADCEPAVVAARAFTAPLADPVGRCRPRTRRSTSGPHGPLPSRPARGGFAVLLAVWLVVEARDTERRQ